jgi:DeoR/GlpR family transcriptional regulator of sugar metabolism
MLRDHCHELILRILRTDGPATVESLSDRLTASQATIRRDTGRSWGS